MFINIPVAGECALEDNAATKGGTVTQHNQDDPGGDDLSVKKDPVPFEAGLQLTRRRFIGRSGGAILAVGGIGSFVAASNAYGSRESSEVVVLTWGGFPTLYADLQKEFKKETGLKLVFVPGGGPPDHFNKVLVGGGGQYDVVRTSVGYISLYVQHKLIEPLDFRKLPNTKELYSPFLTDPRWKQWYLIKPGHLSWAVPHQWGSFNLTYRVDLFQPNGPLSLKDMWNVPEGKVMTNAAPQIMIAYAGRVNGVPWNKVMSMRGADLEAAVQRLRDLKPFAIKLSEADQINSLITGESWIGQVYSLAFANRINAKAGKNICKSVIPVEGAFAALDGLILLKGARNRANALKYINFEAGHKAQNLYWQQLKSPVTNRLTTQAVIARGGPDAQNIRIQQGNHPKIAAGLFEYRPPDNQTAWTHAWDEVLAG
jgi:spermidine/putrescine transport system substrate-binding protein